MSEKDIGKPGIEVGKTTRRGALATFGTAAGLIATSGLASASTETVDILVDPESPEVGEEVTFTTFQPLDDPTWTIAKPSGFERKSGATVSVTFEESGEYGAFVTGDDAQGQTGGEVVDSSDTELKAVIKISPDDPVFNPVTLDGSLSEGAIESYDWHFRNIDRNPDQSVFATSANKSGEVVEESFSEDTTFRIGLEVTDVNGDTDRETVDITPEADPNAPTAVALIDGEERNSLPSNPVELDASESESPNGPIESYTWEIYNRDEGEDETTETGETVTVELDSEVRYTAQLTVKDELGVETTELTGSFWPDADNIPE